MSKTPHLTSDSAEKSLEQQALAQAKARRFKEAITLYKKLLQQDDNGEWRRRLADCYLERAISFAAKGMQKEALVLWENYSQYAQPPYDGYDQYIIWLIQTNNDSKTQCILKQLTAQQLDKDYTELAAVLGLLILTDHPEFQQALPQDSAFIAHCRIAQEAIRAFRNNDPGGLDAALKQLPYRSAFRDFRTLLKASIAASTGLTEAQSLADKIPKKSPYWQAARLLFTCTQNGSDLARELLKFNQPQRKIVEEIIGLNKKQFELVESLCKDKDRLSDKVRFNLVVQFRSLCGLDLSQQFCFSMLENYPAGRKNYSNVFGPIDVFDLNRLKALACENQNNDDDAEYYWKQGITALSKQSNDNHLKIALILRHIAEKQPADEQVNTLIESLDHDPKDKDSTVKVLTYYSQLPQQSERYQIWLNKAIDQFPQDIDVLTLASEVATRNKAFNQAIHYASKILKIDPVNTFAKQVLFNNHLTHARSLIQGKKYHLVENAIEQAEGLRISKNSALQTQLLRGLLGFSSQDKKLGLQQIADVLNKLNPEAINAHFQAVIEAQLNGLPIATILRELPPTNEHLLSTQGLTRLIQSITHYSQEGCDQQQLHKALDKIKAPLKKSLLQKDYEESLLLNLCQTLDTIKHFELLRHCTKQAHLRWQKPIWVYYHIYALTNGDPEQISYLQRMSLELNLGDAKADKDQRAMVLIDQYLQRYYEKHPPIGMDFMESLFDSDEDNNDEDPLAVLFGHLPDEVFDRIDNKADSLAKKTTPEQLVKQLNKIVNLNRTILMAIMRDPDLFAALLLLKAADDLGIHIGITTDNVLEYFGVNQQSESFPFPF